MCVYSGMAVPPATKPDSPSCIATPNPPSLTGAEFSFEANSTQWGCRGRKKDASNSEWKNKLYRRFMVHMFQLVKWGTVLVGLHIFNCTSHFKKNQLTNKCDNALFFLLTKIFKKKNIFALYSHCALVCFAPAVQKCKIPYVQLLVSEPQFQIDKTPCTIITTILYRQAPFPATGLSQYIRDNKWAEWWIWLYESDGKKGTRLENYWQREMLKNKQQICKLQPIIIHNYMVMHVSDIPFLFQ